MEAKLRSLMLWLTECLIVMALTAPTALGASPTTDQYGPRSQLAAASSQGPSGRGGGAGNGPPGDRSTAGNSTIGGLPFTGLDFGVLALAAVAL